MQACSIVRMHIDEGFGQMGRKARRQCGARHRVPLIAQPPRVEAEGELPSKRGMGCVVSHGHDPRALVGVVELTIREEAPAPPFGRLRPAERSHFVVGCSFLAAHR